MYCETSIDSVYTGFPQGLENRENMETNNGQGKVREFYFETLIDYVYKLFQLIRRCLRVQYITSLRIIT